MAEKALVTTTKKRKWESFEQVLGWEAMMAPRLIKAFDLEICLPINLMITDFDNPNTMGTTSVKKDDDDNWYFLISISGNLLDKRDILPTMLHELVHVHCISEALKPEVGKRTMLQIMTDCYNHQGIFAEKCQEIGFRGPFTATSAKPVLLKRLLELDI